MAYMVTAHARRRMAERKIGPETVAATLERGGVIRQRGGSVRVCLRRVCVVVQENRILTVYRKSSRRAA